MKFRTALKGASAPIALSVALLAQPAVAQEAAPAPAEEEEAAEAAVITGDTIFVTGSRIRRDEFSAPAPLTVIDPQIAARQGLLNTGEIVQGSPIAAGSSQVTAALSTQFIVNGGEGVQTVSLRGLGAERTLVMLNGRRAGPAGTRGAVSAFDLNVLPYSIVQSIDVLKDGASSIYGSDAVAGVVNIITKRDTDGVEFDFFGSVPFTTGGEQWSASGTWGKTFDRGHIMVSGSYSRQNELARGDRSYLQCAEANVFTDLTFETRADLIDPRTGNFHCSGNDSNVAWGHVWTYDYSYIYSPTGESNLPTGGGLALLQYSYPGDNLGQYIPGNNPRQDEFQLGIPEGWYAVNYDPASRAVYNNYHPAMNRDSVIPQTDRYTIYAEASFEFSPAAEVYTELLYNNRRTHYNRSGQIYQFGPGTNDQGATDFLFGFDGALGPIGDPLAVGFDGFALYSPTGFLDWFDSGTEVDYYRAVVGLRGDISSSFQYDLYGQYSKSEGSYYSQVILADSIATQDFRGTPLGGPSPCAGTVTEVAGRPCVDIAWYTPRVMYGDLTPEEFNFLTDTEVGNTDYTQWYVEGIVTGDLFELPAGTVGIAVGGTFRRDEIVDTPGAATLAGNVWNGLGAGITAGRSDTMEAFGEVNIPVLRDLPLIESFTVTAAARVTNVEATRASDGASSSSKGNITYKFQADWELTDWLRLRGTYGTSYRAPALFEQFLADQESSLEQRNDPCIQWGTNLANGNISQQFANNCAADGVPSNHTGSGIPGKVITGGGLGVLEPETSKAWTASVILTPDFSFLPDTRVSLAVDYFNIEVNGQVARLGAANVIAQCYSSEFFPNDPLCSLFARVGDLDPSDPYWNAGNANNLAFARDSFININSQQNRGIDFTGRIVHDFPGDVTLTVQGQVTLQTRDTVALFDGLSVDNNGLAGEPKWVGDFSAQLDAGPWSFFYGLDVIGSTDNTQYYYDRNALTATTPLEDVLCRNLTTYPGPVCYNLKVPTTFYHSASVTREFADNFRITAGISNLLDKRPPQTSNVAGDGINQFGNGVLYSQYDLLGRRAFVNLNIRY